MLPSHKIVFTDLEIERMKESIEDIMRSGRVILGKYTAEFERSVADYCGRRFAVSCASETAAFEMSLRAIDIRGQEVIFPANGFAGVLVAVYRAGGIPVFVDIEVDRGIGPTVEAIREKINADTAAVCLMHTGGYMIEQSQAIVDECKRLGVFVFEDAAHCMGSRLDSKPAGAFGDVSAFSTYATKPMTTLGEGGILVTDSERIAKKARLLRNYGRVGEFGKSVIVDWGYSWRMTEIQAAAGALMMESLDENVAGRQRAMDFYDDVIPWNDWHEFGVRKVDAPLTCEPNGYRYLLLLESSGMERLELYSRCKDAGLDLPGPVYEMPIHEQPFLGGRFEHMSFPKSEHWCNRHFALPVWRGIDQTDQSKVIEIVDTVLKSAN